MSENKIDDSTVLARAPGVRFRRVRDRLMLILDTQVFELNETAELAWTLADGDKSFQKIVDVVADTYDASPETVRADLEELFSQLLELKALEKA